MSYSIHSHSFEGSFLRLKIICNDVIQIQGSDSLAYIISLISFVFVEFILKFIM